MNTVRVVTQTLVLVVACPAPGAYVYRDIVAPGSSSSQALVARQLQAVEAMSRTSQARDSWRSVEREADYAEAPVLVSLDLSWRHRDYSTPSFLSRQSISDAPAPQRGPPVLS
jgi:hypothetical protein